MDHVAELLLYGISVLILKHEWEQMLFDSLTACNVVRERGCEEEVASHLVCNTNAIRLAPPLHSALVRADRNFEEENDSAARLYLVDALLHERADVAYVLEEE